MGKLRRLSVVFLVLNVILCSAQTQEEVIDELKKFDTLSQLAGLYERHPDWSIEVINAQTDISSISDMVRKLLDGEIAAGTDHSGTYHYKLINIDSIRQMRVSYIFLNGDKLSKKQRRCLPSFIIESYKDGEDFKILNALHDMSEEGGNGELDWFGEGQMFPEMEQAIINHEKGDIFLVSLTDTPHQYIVLKTFDDKLELELSIAKIQSKL